MLRGRRGVVRIALAPSNGMSTLSIQPKHSSSSTASAQGNACRPLDFDQTPIHSSVADAWFASSQARSSAAEAKNRTSCGSSRAMSRQAYPRRAS